MTDKKKMPDEEGPVPRTSRCNACAAKKAARRLSLMYDTVLAPVGLKSSQYGILSELHSRGAALPTVRELAEELVMDRSTLGQNLRPLERDELITLLTDPNDRRNRLIALTRLGIAKLNEAAKYWKIAQDRFEATFGKQEAADLRSVLFAIAHNPEFAKEKITSAKTSRAKALVRFSRYRVAQEAAREENWIKLEGNRVSASFQGL